MRLTEDDIELMYDIPINEQVISILKVPSEPFAEKEKEPVMAPTSGRQSAGAQKGARLRKNAAGESEGNAAKKIPPSDYLFVLTSNFKCILYKHSAEMGLVV